MKFYRLNHFDGDDWSEQYFGVKYAAIDTAAKIVDDGYFDARDHICNVFEYDVGSKITKHVIVRLLNQSFPGTRIFDSKDFD